MDTEGKQYKISNEVTKLIIEAKTDRFQEYNLEGLVKAAQEISFNLRELKDAKVICEDTIKKNLIEDGLVSYLTINRTALNRHLNRIRKSR